MKPRLLLALLIVFGNEILGARVPFSLRRPLDSLASLVSRWTRRGNDETFEYDPVKSLEIAQLTSVAYCRDWNSLLLWNCTRCSGLDFVPSAVINDTSWNLFAYVGFSPRLSSIVVSFRGTDSGSLYNWITDISSLRTGLDVDLDSNDPDFANSTDPILVHSGFFSAYNNSALKPGVRSAVAQQLSQYGPKTPIVVSGHSLGGALAALCTLDLISIYGKDAPISSYTFGSPRVGNARFAEVYKSLVKESVRMTHGRDIVPSLPYMLMGFRHSAWEIYLVDVVKDTGETVQLFQICNGSGEDPQCHDGACTLGLCSSIDDHLNYLGVYLAANYTLDASGTVTSGC